MKKRKDEIPLEGRVGQREDETVVNGMGPGRLWKDNQCSFCAWVVVTCVTTRVKNYTFQYEYYISQYSKTSKQNQDTRIALQWELQNVIPKI